MIFLWKATQLAAAITFVVAPVWPDWLYWIGLGWFILAGLDFVTDRST